MINSNDYGYIECGTIVKIDDEIHTVVGYWPFSWDTIKGKYDINLDNIDDVFDKYNLKESDIFEHSHSKCYFEVISINKGEDK